LVGETVNGATVDESDTVEGVSRPLRADARRNRFKVIGAAQAVFSEHGPDARMEEVAEKAGVAVGTLYRHFPNKEALLEALIAERLGQIADFARKALYQDAEPWEAFAVVIRYMVKMAYEDRAFARIAPRLGAEGELGEARRRIATLLGKLIERAQEARKMRADVDAEDIPPLFLGVVLSTTHDKLSSAHIERYVEIILDGLRFQADQGPTGG
jgi:AcrR family transcriptional regulator